MLLDKGVDESKILFLTVIAAPEGIRRICGAYPRLRVLTSEIDEGMEDLHIVPGERLACWMGPGCGKLQRAPGVAMFAQCGGVLTSSEVDEGMAEWHIAPGGGQEQGGQEACRKEQWGLCQQACWAHLVVSMHWACTRTRLPVRLESTPAPCFPSLQAWASGETATSAAERRAGCVAGVRLHGVGARHKPGCCRYTSFLSLPAVCSIPYRLLTVCT